MASYWTQTLQARISRRRALAGAAGASAAAAILAACGGGGSSDTPKGSSGLITDAVDSTKTATRNGVMKERSYGDPPTLDGFTANNPWNGVAPHAYSTFVRNKIRLPDEEESIGPDIAESWETSPDGLTVTMKMRQGVKWHNKAPINGRAFDIEDVIFSWDRFARRGSARSGVANSVNPQAPVLSITATDSRTFVVKLKEPLVYTLGLFTSNSSGGILVIPKETDSTYNIANDVIGTGPWWMSNYTPSLGFTFKRNNDYWDKDAAMVETIEQPLVTEAAQAIAQVKAGNMYDFGTYAPLRGLAAENILPIKREEPRILIYTNDAANPAPASGTVTNFGWMGNPKSPFMDERVRQAASMAIDRDLYLDTFANRADFESQGLPIETFWNTAVGYSEPFVGWWLDPKSKEFGANAKYFKYDPAEAKKLLSAAGYPNGFDTTSHQVTGPELATVKHAVVIDAFWSEVGMRSKVESIDYSKDYIPNYRDGKGKYEGWAYKSSSGGPPSGGEAIGSLTVHYWSQSALWHGFVDPAIDSMIEKGRIEQDTEKRKAIVHDIQRELAAKMYAIQAPGAATGFLMAWPCVGNFRAFRNTRLNERLWIDETKPPFRNA